MNATIFTTTGTERETPRTVPFQSDREEVENEVINLYPELSFETLEGFGGAITESAAYVYSLMSAEQKKELMEEYFSPARMNYNRVRIPLDSCDFSLGLYEAMPDPKNCTPGSFSFARTERYILPMLRDAERTAGKRLKLMLSPWSPPAFMKTNGSRIHGGSLKPEYYGRWAEYLCCYIREFQKRGFDVERISLQNEPHAVQTWDSCIYSGQKEKAFLKVMTKAMREHGLDNIEVFIWDHNKERAYERAVEVIDEETRPLVSGIACHWYSGDHFESLELLKAAFLELRLIISESCIEFSQYASGDAVTNARRLAHEMIGDFSHGMCAFYDWNLLLDEKGGPNYADNYCDAPFMFHTDTGELEYRPIQRYFYHFSHFIQPGARRIGFSRYTDRVEVLACRNPDGNLAVVLLNRETAPQPVILRLNGQIAGVTVPAGSISTVVVTGDNP